MLYLLHRFRILPEVWMLELTMNGIALGMWSRLLMELSLLIFG